MKIKRERSLSRFLWRIWGVSPFSGGYQRAPPMKGAAACALGTRCYCVYTCEGTSWSIDVDLAPQDTAHSPRMYCAKSRTGPVCAPK